MDHSRNSNHHQQQLGVNKMGKSIRKSPLHQPAYHNHRPYPPPPTNHPPQQQQPQPQPQVYNISKNDFRSIVQQLTGTPSRDSTPGPAAPQPRPSSSRLQKIRPPPLAPIARPPPLPPPHATRPQPHPHAHPPPPFPNPNLYLNHNRAVFPRPEGPSWAESPVSAYMRYLESSLFSSDTSRHPRPPQPLPSPGLLPSPRPSFPLPAPRGIPNSASLPPATPPSAIPSPTAFLDLLSPRSPYPLLSPGFPYPPPLTPNFALSPLPQPGILGAGPSPGPQPLPSPGLWFPQSPSGLLPILSPRWRDML